MDAGTNHKSYAQSTKDNLQLTLTEVVFFMHVHAAMMFLLFPSGRNFCRQRARDCGLLPTSRRPKATQIGMAVTPGNLGIPRQMARGLTQTK
jgi:hypothetical protein